MKKLLSLVLICAMGFGMISCVESEESPSVENIRNAKAEQLKAYAEYYKAQAQAEIIVAEAEAALNAAKAEYQQNQTAEAKAKFAYEIEMLKVKYEKEMLEHKKAALGYEKEILDAMNALEDATNARIADLYAAYSGYLENYNDANESLLNAKRRIAQVELEVVDIQTAANDQIKDNEEKIADEKENIAEYEAKLAILKEDVGNVDADSLYKDYLKARTAYNNEYAKFLENETKAKTEAENAAKEASTAFFKSIDDKKAEEGIANDIFAVTQNNNGEWQEEYQSWDNQVQYVFYADVDDGNGGTVRQYMTDWAPYGSNYSWNINGVQWHMLKVNDNPVIAGINDPEDVFTDYRGKAAAVSVDIDESNLLSFKNTSASSLKTAQSNLESAEKALKVATDAKAAMEGFKADFEKAAEAKKAIDAFAEAYGKYDEDTETVKAKEAKLAQVKADTVDVAGTNGVVNVYGNYFYKPYETLINAKAALDELTNPENEDYEDNTYVKALADAKAALAALPTTATAAEKAAAEGDVTTAQKALDKEIYGKGVYLESAKATVAKYEDDIKTAEKEVAEAQENKEALLAASTAVEAAVETLNAIFGEESDFYAFWNNEDEDGNKVNQIAGISGISTMYATVLADLNNDKTPDLDLTADNGLYLTDNEQYSYFATEYDALLAKYVENIAKETDNVATYTKAVKSLGEWVNNWDAKETELREFVKAKNAEIAEINALYEAAAEAKEAYDAKDAELDEMKTNYEAIMTKYQAISNPNSVPSQIAALEKNIETSIDNIEKYEAAIAKAKEILAGLRDKDGNAGINNNTIEYKNYLIEQYKNQIAEYEADVEFYAQMIETTKAALDAALSALNAAE